MSKERIGNREVILEYHSLGSLVKVCAMDVQSLVEVSIQGPSSASQEILKRNAMKRLEYVLKKQGLL